jgi:23S rRNA (cytidine1920-2'-O)/16S rRNA (cytidine1409-2'-O)-methyltransferase
MPEQRLDAALAARGLARSRTHAATLIAAGVVSVDGRSVVKPALKVAESAVLEVRGIRPLRQPCRATSSSRRSTGSASSPQVASCSTPVLDRGFSQVLLERGARTVLAVDVGHGQLAPELRDAPGLVLVEGCNVRHLDRPSLAAQTGVDEPPSLVTAVSRSSR